jgi:hypothetical protein
VLLHLLQVVLANPPNVLDRPPVPLQAVQGCVCCPHFLQVLLIALSFLARGLPCEGQVSEGCCMNCCMNRRKLPKSGEFEIKAAREDENAG